MRPRPLLDAASRFGAAILGLVLLVAAWAKMIHPVAFAGEIEAQGLAVGLPPGAWAVLFVGFEAGLGTLLLLAVRRRWVLTPATALVGLFLFLNGRAYWRFANGLIGADESCGCFGSLVERTPAEAFWQDLVLLVPPLVLAWLGARGVRGRAVDWRAAVAGVVTAAALLVAWKAPELPFDDLATRLSPGREIADLCAGQGEERACLDILVPELTSGRHLVVMAEVVDPALVAAVPGLNRLAGEGGEILWLLTPSSEQERQLFFFQAAPAFSVREVPLPLLEPLYRALPRSFRVVEGRVVETFAGLPPAAAP
ncbi:MAG: hypothetical protein R3325_10460 [Thermoanaerobaculia bacterium]|nr:hypothetical protein [Thermoanaerobaculia bacterium]